MLDFSKNSENISSRMENTNWDDSIYQELKKH